MVIKATVGMGLAMASAGTAQVLGSVAPLWRGVSQIVLVCGEHIDPTLCAAALAAARARTALPVEHDTNSAAADRGIVLLTVSTEQDRAGRQLVAVARRAVEIDEAESPARQAVAWPAASPDADLDIIDALLARLLPPRPGIDRP